MQGIELVYVTQTALTLSYNKIASALFGVYLSSSPTEGPQRLLLFVEWLLQNGGRVQRPHSVSSVRIRTIFSSTSSLCADTIWITFSVLFKLRVLSFCVALYEFLYILDLRPLSDKLFENIFSDSVGFLFYFIDSVLWCTNFLFLCSSVYLFFLLLHMPWYDI